VTTAGLAQTPPWSSSNVTPEVAPVAAPDELVGTVLRRLTGHRFETVSAIAVCVGDELRGLVKLEDLLAAPVDVALASVMDADPPKLEEPGEESLERAAWRAVQRGESTVALTTSGNRYLGVVSPHGLLQLLLAEHEEDMARLGGFLRGTRRVRQSSEEPIPRRFWHRLPWLILGLGGAVLAAEIVAAFEQQLSETVLLAFFIPGIVYMADAVGTQTEALIVRGLSVGIPIGHVIRRELATGLLIGLTVAAVFLPIGLWRWGDPQVALTVSIALLASCSTATVVGMALPWALARRGLDPAFGTGPLATVIQDLLSVLIYLSVAGVLVR
jgi:magnesium transporter